jgi:hypothetical protein
VYLRNTAPNANLPRSVIGPAEGLEDRFVAGENFSVVSLYTPLTVTSATLDGQQIDFDTEEELGRNVTSAWYGTPSGVARKLDLRVDGYVPLRDGGWYHLDLVRQPFLAADSVELELRVPDGWEIDRTRNVRAMGDQVARGTYALAETADVGVRIRSGGGLNLWDRLEHGS